MRHNYSQIPRYVPHAVSGHALNQNESQFELPLRLKNKIQQMSLEALSRYPIDELSLLKKSYATYAGISSEQLMTGSGSDELLAILCQAILDTEDIVLAPVPDFSMYGIYAYIARGKFIQPDENGLTIESMLRSIEMHHPKLVLLSNPNNPTGKMWAIEEIEEIAKRVPFLVVDEAYIDFTMESSFIKRLTDYPNVIILRTLSKAFGLANLRIGFMIAHSELIESIDRFRSPFNVSGLSATVATIVLEDTDYIRQSVAFHIEQREKLERLVAPIGKILPSQANFLFIETPLSQQWADRFYAYGIHVRAFETGLRISAGTDEAYELIQQMLEEVNSIENS